MTTTPEMPLVCINARQLPSLGAGAVASRGRTQADARLADEHPEGT